MMNDENVTLRPFLTRYEVEIPDGPETKDLVYDETRMILLLGGLPAFSISKGDLLGGTKQTLIERETTDDD